VRKKSPKRCAHRALVIQTEADGCSWVECIGCGKTGPCKHSYMLALICFATATVNQHPRREQQCKPSSQQIKRRKSPMVDRQGAGLRYFQGNTSKPARLFKPALK
jgi:hypothetical protein